MAITAVLFDMDGLMFDTERLSDGLWVEAARVHGYDISADGTAVIRGRNRDGGRAASKAMYGEAFPFDEIYDEMLAALRARLDEHVPMRPGLVALLETLQKRGIVCAVASSTHRALVESNLRGAGVADYFSALICGDMVQHSKPAPDIYLRATQALGAAPQQCMVLEDSYNGVRAGHAAGCFTVMVPDMDPVTPEMETLADAIVPALTDVIALLG